MIKRILKISARLLCFLFISILIGYNVFLLNAKYVLHDKLPMLGGYGHAVVLSGSMKPAIDENDLLVIHKQDSYEINDIVTYIDYENTPVTHRIIEINGSSVRTQGDANNVPDSEFDVERIKGKVIAIIPKMGYVVDFLQNPLCVICVVTIALILLEHSYSLEKKNKTANVEAIKAEIDALKAEMDNKAD